ncbi:GSCOCG00000323001-RA-CDS [Cotesia congregata]|uniref:Large ribosomal subunit protein bL32m n=1 Tax=Cotesia congregata TaxID=51543 RepID=A0A8J2HCF9_COTCN|nr:GSCOCG00000323001-RA-CDS [Cotesia congregata]CAG5088335.1 Similar to mRpL32: 39S ribosomal protein L32 [Cotesia congregata]
MAKIILRSLDIALYRVEETLGYLFGTRFPPALCTLELNSIENKSSAPNSKPLTDILKDGLLWAVPKSRRSLEKRMKRKYGSPEYNWKPFVPKTNIVPCITCGLDREADKLCQHCYNKVKLETKEMQEVIVNTLGLEPVEKDVVVLYEGEKDKKPAEFWKGQRIVELPKPRPAWFHSNLMQPTTQEPSQSTEVKPTELA